VSAEGWQPRWSCRGLGCGATVRGETPPADWYPQQMWRITAGELRCAECLRREAREQWEQREGTG